MREAPFWFSTSALVLLLFIFLSCAASLIAVDRVIASQDGLPLSVSSNPYSWTYGPTAILIVILSLWRRLDYHFKLREPWRELLAGPLSGEKICSARLHNTFPDRELDPVLEKSSL